MHYLYCGSQKKYVCSCFPHFHNTSFIFSILYREDVQSPILIPKNSTSAMFSPYFRRQAFVYFLFCHEKAFFSLRLNRAACNFLVFVGNFLFCFMREPQLFSGNLVFCICASAPTATGVGVLSPQKSSGKIRVAVRLKWKPAASNTLVQLLPGSRHAHKE